MCVCVCVCVCVYVRVRACVLGGWERGHGEGVGGEALADGRGDAAAPEGRPHVEPLHLARAVLPHVRTTPRSVKIAPRARAVVPHADEARPLPLFAKDTHLVEPVRTRRERTCAVLMAKGQGARERARTHTHTRTHEHTHVCSPGPPFAGVEGTAMKPTKLSAPALPGRICLCVRVRAPARVLSPPPHSGLRPGAAPETVCGPGQTQLSLIVTAEP